MIKLTTPDLRLRSLWSTAKVILSGNLTQGEVSASVEDLSSELLFGGSPTRVVSSASTGLNLGLRALGIGPGDEVLVPAFTFPATANAVLQLGAIPVLVDVEPDTYNISIRELELAISQNTKAIIPVHAFGLPADMPGLMELANAHKLKVVEDAACAIGATIDGVAVGTIGDLGVFSFHPRKVVTCGEGGLLVVNRDEVMDRVDLLRSHGSRRGEVGFVFEDWGYNYRMSDLAASFLLDQLKSLKGLLLKRRRAAELYMTELGNESWLRLPPSGSSHTYQSFVVQLDPRINRNQVIRELRNRGIESTLGTYNLARQPFMVQRGYAPKDMPASDMAQLHSLSLPISSRLKAGQIRHITHTLKKVVRDATSGGQH